jgi:hypothetical protein
MLSARPGAMEMLHSFFGGDRLKVKEMASNALEELLTLSR